MRKRNFSFLVLLTTSLSISAGTWSQPGQYVSAAGNAEQKVLTSSGSSKSASQEKWTAASLDLTTVTSSANTTATLKTVPTTYNLPDGAQPDAPTVKADATAALELNDYTFTASTANVTLTGVSTPNTGTAESEIWKFVGADDVKLSATNLGDECITEFNNQYVTAGNGNPSLSAYQYYYTNSDGDEVGPRYIEDYWTDGCNSAPLKGCYYKFDVNAPGKLVIGFCLNSNLTYNPLYIIDAATYTRIPSSTVTIQGFRKQYSYETNQGGTTKLTQFTLNDNGLIVIPDGLGSATNLNLYGYITLNLEAASSFYLLSLQSQMGIYGFEFTSNNATTTGECGNGVTWSKTGTELTISKTGDGDGKMADYRGERGPWGKDITKVTIGEGVTSIGYGAFSVCSELTDVTIGSSVTTIGDEAFGSCSKLTDVTIPSSVTSIGISAFSICYELTDVTIGSSVTTIGDNAFGSCSKLTDVTIPSSVTTIGMNAFYGCSSLTTVIVEAESAALGVYAFMYTDYDKGSVEILPNLTAIYVPADKVDAYKEAENWKNYKDYIMAITYYTATLAEGTDDAGNWTIEPAEAKTTGVTAGTALTLTYSGTREVKSVKAVEIVEGITLDKSITTWSEGAYIVPEGGLTYGDGDAITVSGDVTLVLTDDETLTLNKGISLAEGATLTVEGNGTMNVNGTNENTASTVAGTGTLVLTSGTLNAKGGNGQGVDDFAYNTDNRAYAGGNAINGSVTVSGGTLTATGGNGGGVGEWSANSYGAAGGVAISGTVTVTDGTVTATGGNGGSIGPNGANEYGGDGGAAIGGDATISGGTWTATDGTDGVDGDGEGGDGGKAVAGTVTDNR